MKNKRFTLILALGAGLLLAAGGGYWWWRSSVLQRTGGVAIRDAQTALTEGRAAEALALLDRVRPSPEEAPAWQDLEIKAATGAGRVERLTTIYAREPQRVQANEDASLLVYKAKAIKGEEEAAEALRSVWSGKTARQEEWTITRADALIAAGKGADARLLLEAATGWKPADEIQRLMRLAILTAPEGMESSWKLLEQAYKLDPSNADVRSFRGQIKEAAGRREEARVEYVAALVAEPANPLRRDQLAEFYLRQGDFDHAVPTLLDPGTQTEPGFLELKGRFWAKVVNPSLAAKPSAVTSTGSGPWQAALEALELAPPGRWVAPVTGPHAPALLQHGELWWLALLDQFQSGDEEGAAATLAAQPAKAFAMAPDLSAALKCVLALRVERSTEGTIWPVLRAGAVRPAFFVKLQQMAAGARAGAAVAENDETVLRARHKAAIAYTFASAGWREAALLLYKWESGEGIPESMLYTAAMCTRLNRGPAAVLPLLAGRQETLLNGLAAECLIASGQTEAGLVKLRETSAENSDAGRRAGWLLATALLERQDYAGVRAALAGTPGLAENTEGIDIAARLALAEGRTDEATALYEKSAGRGSAEGRTWMLRQAVAAGDAAASREQSAKLRELLPDQLQTVENQRNLPEAVQ